MVTEDSKLGIVPSRHVEHLFDGILVMGANQFFSRECVENIGDHKLL